MIVHQSKFIENYYMTVKSKRYLNSPREMLDEIKGAFGSTMVTLVKIGKREDVQLPFRDFTIHFISNSLLPYFESRVKFLNESVSSKRGFIPAVSTWFKATSKKPAGTQ